MFHDKINSDLIIAVNVILALTSVVSVGIRFYRPSSEKYNFDLQNAMLCLAAFCGTVMSVTQCVATKYGLGLHFATLSESNVQHLLKAYAVIMAFHFACNMFVKFALLIFYLRTTYKRVHLWAIWIMIFVAFGFGISSMAVFVFQCSPVDKLWHPAKPGSCINITSFYWANSIIMIVNDSIMYIMPIIFTWHLSLRTAQRVVLNLLFALGSVVIVVSVLRLLSLIRFTQSHGDFSYHIASILLWSAIENHTAIFITCTPSIKALVTKTLVPFVTSVQSTVGEKIRTLRTSQASSPRSNLDSRNAHQFPIGNMQHHLVGKTTSQPAPRQSMDSNNSGYNFAAERAGRLDSCTSAGITRAVSQDSFDKGTCVSVVPMEELEAQILPPYTYIPKQDIRK